MKIEEQVVSLELAKQLKELGIEQDSHFYWDNRTEKIGYQLVNKDFFKVDKRNSISAFTATELLEMLPKELEIRNYTHKISIKTRNFTDKTIYQVHYINLGLRAENLLEEDENICNALAKMLVFLKQNNLTN